MIGAPLRLFNSMGRSQQEFKPVDPSSVKVFTCGPSVYAGPHLGNYRTFLFEDVLVRYLRFKGYGVRRAMNITDLEDKSVIESLRQKIDIGALTKKNEFELLATFRRLRIDLPDRMPRSSRSLKSSVRIIKDLMMKGVAYRHGDDIFFDPLKYAGFGRLYGLDMSKWPIEKRRFKKDTYPGNRWNLGDFILWHGCGAGLDVCFDADLGPGRPSWNVQDPAMVLDTFGGSVDIWCGGSDNLIRHHDYNIAVTESFTGVELAPFWLHGGPLLIDGKKMSKSKGNAIHPSDLAAKGYSWSAMRFFLLDSPYGEPLDLTYSGLDSASARLKRITDSIFSLKSGGTGSPVAQKAIARIVPEFTTMMDNDLDYRGAFGSLEESMEILRAEKLSSLQKGELVGSLRSVDSVLGVLFQGQV